MMLTMRFTLIIQYEPTSLTNLLETYTFVGITRDSVTGGARGSRPLQYFSGGGSSPQSQTANIQIRFLTNASILERHYSRAQ
ncbi:hypothetical protein V5799_025481 [Amblyomma americanum]|uniref:Uncharacterized protein n=1 Tax=Amblyomma americanum TaxID=6943 RepID=A0AAQ4E9F8_AMBAM